MPNFVYVIYNYFLLSVLSYSKNCCKSEMNVKVDAKFWKGKSSHLRDPRQSWILDSKPWILNSLSVKFGCRTPNFSGIPDSLSRNSDYQAHDSGFPSCPGFRNPNSLAWFEKSKSPFPFLPVNRASFCLLEWGGEKEVLPQPCIHARSRYPSYQRRLGTECGSANFPDKLDRWHHIRSRRGRLGTRLVLPQSLTSSLWRHRTSFLLFCSIWICKFLCAFRPFLWRGVGGGGGGGWWFLNRSATFKVIHVHTSGN